MALVVFLVLFPLLIAAAMLICGKTARGIIIKAASALIAAASIALLVIYSHDPSPAKFSVNTEIIGLVILAVEFLIAAYIIFTGIKHKKFGVVALAAVQLAGTLVFEGVFGEKIVTQNQIVLDNLSLMMTMLIGIVGTLICIFAIGYMDKYHHHKGMKDRSKMFFATIFAFLSAMFGLVFSNDLMWLLFFWEVTTFASFLLIGYTQQEDSTKNSFRALFLNMIGGLAFFAAIVYLFARYNTVELDKVLGLDPAAILLPAVFICFAGMVKSAQMPFSSWLLGAMVAPTPVSALLHSSTMVKAGLYIILRFSPVLQGTMAGTIISLIGAVTFLFASFIAISKHNVKKLLAYSTISILGLVVTCAGIGTYQAVWTGILLMIFHAVAKSLLFLCVGTVEQGIESLNIEDMDGLIMRMPKITGFLLIGIAGMFLAPFGMLISKWAALEALIQVNPIIAFFVVFGSSATLFFYTKWMGKLIMIIHPAKIEEGFISKDEWFTMTSLSVLNILICLVFPLISRVLIDPYIQIVYNHKASMGAGNVMIMLIMMGLIFLLPLQILLMSKNKKYVPTYLCGANITENDVYYEANTRYHTGARMVSELKLKNYYMEKYFGEERLIRLANISTAVLLAGLLLVTML